MRYIWIALVVVLFSVFVYFVSPVDKSVYDNYVDNVCVNSKGNFMSKKEFGIDRQVEGSDNQASTNTSLVNAKIQSTPGHPQGLWGNSAGATLKEDEFLQICRSVVADADNYIQYFGLAQADTPNTQAFNVDKWKDVFSDSVGTVQYLQTEEPFNILRHKFALPNHTATVGGSGCGSAAMSIIFSTILHKHITIAEVCAGIGTYNARYGTNIMFHTADSRAGALNQWSQLELVFADMKFNGKDLLVCEHALNMDKAKVDDALDNGGMVMFVSKGSRGDRSVPYWTLGSGHWIVMREHLKDTDEYLMVDGANTEHTAYDQRRTQDPNTPSPYAIVSGAAKENVFYVKPGPGYEDYINAMK